MARRLRATASAALSRFPASWFRYRFTPSGNVVGYARQAGDTVVRPLAERHQPTGTLPQNVNSIEALPTTVSRWRRSFAEVPTRCRAAPSMIELHDVEVLEAGDEWDLGHFTVLAPGPVRLTGAGLRFLPSHRRLLTSGAQAQRVEYLAWPWESWYVNYSIWMTSHLPKLAWFRSEGLLDHVVVPLRFEPNRFQRESAELIGVDLDRLQHSPGERLRAGRLVLIDVPEPHPLVIEMLRGIRVPERAAVSSGSRIFIRRKLPGRRQIVNEAELVSLVESFGFSCVVMEDLSVADQITMFRRAEIVIGLHGAGLANIAFAPTGAHVIEIVDPTFPNPVYFELATVAGLRYSMILGSPVDGNHPWGYRDVRVDPSSLWEVVSRALQG